MPRTHEYEPDDAFYGVESAADDAADEILREDKLLRQLETPADPDPLDPNHPGWEDDD